MQNLWIDLQFLSRQNNPNRSVFFARISVPKLEEEKNATQESFFFAGSQLPFALLMEIKQGELNLEGNQRCVFNSFKFLETDFSSQTFIETSEWTRGCESYLCINVIKATPD